MSEKAKIEDYTAPAGGWGSVHAVASILTQEEVTLLGSEILLRQNKPSGFMCVSCSWAKPAKPHPFEFCENGAKATAWEITRRRSDRSSSPGTASPTWTGTTSTGLASRAGLPIP